MNSKKKLLEKINPKLLEITPKSSFEADSVITLEIGKNDVNNEAQKLMERFYKRQELILKSKCIEDNIELKTSKEICQSISEKLFSNVKLPLLLLKWRPIHMWIVAFKSVVYDRFTVKVPIYQ